MFGYIKPVRAELKVKEDELYRAVYCGLCDSLGRVATCKSRLTLSYDFVFLALVRMALADEVGALERHRCIAHPTKKRTHLAGSRELDYSARVSVLLTYHKLKDDINDEQGAKRLAAKMLLPAARSMRRHALAGLEELDKSIEARLSELSELERNRVYSPDRAAEPFGALMSEVCAFGLEGRSARIASELGRQLGRFIYILDAADDLAGDLKSGAYNPFRLEGETDEAILAELESRKESLERSLTMELTRLSAALELIDEPRTPEFLSILRNIIYLGMPLTIRGALFGEADKPNLTTENYHND